MELATISAENYPTVYENAKSALIECANLDECKGWTDRALAMEVYAKQASDDVLLKMAMRIKLRAAKKCGELINAIPSSQGQDLGGASPRSQIIKDNSISKDQSKTYQRIANVPDEEFESQVESEDVPTMTAMSEQGKKTLLNKMSSTSDFPIHWVGALNRLIEQSKKIEPSGLQFYDQEEEIKISVSVLIKYLEKIV